MKRPRKRTWIAGIVAFGLALPLTPAGPALADSMEKVKVVLVKVVNDGDKPVLVRDVEQPARQVFREVLTCTADPGELACSSRFFIPSGKLLVIETLSAGVTVPAGQQPAVSVGVGSFPPEFGFAVPLETTAAIGGSEFFGALRLVRIYAGPGEQVGLLLLRAQSAQTGSATLTVSGHLVDCGAGPGCPVP